eukprot:TRINITY_DN1793_c0_g1_i7.p1 TRINITY_DN1793_c0_g1~~TRINITY_DN1793_c0_g1_i7.p1  ORF type:complete len:172 (-),score=36.24 TRINITY_DN1793_c0_g1_i7:320-835(-)
MDGGFRDMELLAQLLESSKQACDEQDLEGPSERDSLSDASKLTPGNIATGGSFSGPSGAPPNTQIRSTKKSSGDIWDDDEVPSQAAFTEIDDGRVKPRYEFLYRQKVGSEDLYLGLGDKDPTSASCEQLVVRIYFPDTKASEINLDVTSNYVDCRTKKIVCALLLLKHFMR